MAVRRQSITYNDIYILNTHLTRRLQHVQLPRPQGVDCADHYFPDRYSFHII